MATDPLRHVRAAAARARHADEASAAATRQRDAAIRAAYLAGERVRDIAAAAGLSYQRVSQLARRSVK